MMASRALQPRRRPAAVRQSPSRVPGWLGDRLSRVDWSAVLALVSGLLTFIVTTGGLFIMTPWLQSAVIAGIVAGLVARKVWMSGVIGALVGVSGTFLGPQNWYNPIFWFTPRWPTIDVKQLLGTAAVCAGVAVLATLASRLSKRATPGLIALAFVILIAGLWFTPLSMNMAMSTSYGTTPFPPFNEVLDTGKLPSVQAATDAGLFFEVYKGTKAGEDFYAEYARVLDVKRGGVSTLADYREPMLFWLWSLLPNARSVVIAYLALVTVVVLSVIPLTIALNIRPPLMVPAAAALASYLTFFSVYPELFRQDAWAGAIGVLAVAAYAVSLRSQRWRIWTGATVVLTVLAVLTRETMAFLLIGGVVSAFLGDRSQRRFRQKAWMAGALAFAALFCAHAMAAWPYLLHTPGIPRAGEGSLSFMLEALSYGTGFLGGGGWQPLVIGLIGIAAVLMLREPRLRTFALISTLGPLASFFVIGNSAVVFLPGDAVQHVNYWGMAVVPLLYALLPWAFTIIPHGEYQTARTTGSEGSEPA